MSPKTPIHGSFTNLVDYLFIRGGSGVSQIKYLIGRKNSDTENVTQLMLLDFIISRANFVEIMLATNNADLLEPVAGALKQHIQVWQDSPEWRLKMFEILTQTTGYDAKRGMFYKNLDAAGTFDDAASKPRDPALKSVDYEKEKRRYTRDLPANKQGATDATAGLERNFEAWLETQDIEDLDPRQFNALKKKYNTGYDEAKSSQVAESYFGEFHEREKMLMEEDRQLMESTGTTGGKQWEITAAATAQIAGIANVEYYGELDLSDENIKACADIYIEKLGENLTTLLKTTEEFTNNIGKYFSADRRSTAMNANKQAQAEGQEVVDLLAKDEKEPVKEI